MSGPQAFKREVLEQRLRKYQRQELRQTHFPGFRRAGVLVPIFPTKSGLSVLLTLRTESVDAHKGQVSFPGGMMNEDDRDIVETALRESCEEIGLDPSAVRILGLLDDVSVPSKFLITPVVGYLVGRPPAKPSEVEVAEVFDVPLAYFANDQNARREERDYRGGKIQLWFFDHNGRNIWGATASILRNLARIAYPLE